MASEDDSEKSEEASQSRRDDFRKRGEVAQTRELGTALLLLTSAALISGMAKAFIGEMYSMFRQTFGENLVYAIRHEDMVMMGAIAGKTFAMVLLPVMGLAVFIGVGSSFVQVGLLQIEDALSLKFDRLDPIAGFSRVFSLKSILEGAKAFIKMLVIGGIAYYVLKGQAQRLPFLSELSVEEMFAFMGLMTVKLLAVIGFAMLVMAGADYFYSWWDLEKKMMMTKQEVKEEHKSREGDPMIKARIRRIQRDVANRRMMEKVAEADVIITNPTHIAVALKYDDNLPAPQLVAKGGDLMAERIKEIAREKNIPILENKPLARTIFKTMKIGQVIPRELYVAVAEVLSYVFKLRRRFKSGRGS